MFKTIVYSIHVSLLSSKVTNTLTFQVPFISLLSVVSVSTQNAVLTESHSPITIGSLDENVRL